MQDLLRLLSLFICPATSIITNSKALQCMWNGIETSLFSRSGFFLFCRFFASFLNFVLWCRIADSCKESINWDTILQSLYIQFSVKPCWKMLFVDDCDFWCHINRPIHTKITFTYCPNDRVLNVWLLKVSNELTERMLDAGPYSEGS